MNLDWTKYLLGGLLIIFTDQILLQHLSLWGIHFDALLLFLIWTLPNLNRTEAIYIYGSLAFLQDALYDSWGLMLFSKTLIILLFHAYLINRSQGNVFSSQFAILTLTIALTHNTIYYLLALVTGGYASGLWPYTILLLGALYTTLLSFILHKIVRS
jgi:hypothetical protein